MIPTPTVVYVSGPLTTGDTIANIRAAVQAGHELIRRGYVAIIPHEKALCMELMYPKSYDEWLAYDFRCILRCDALLRLPGASKGGDAEVEFAHRHNIPVYFNLDSLFLHEPADKTRPYESVDPLSGLRAEVSL